MRLLDIAALGDVTSVGSRQSYPYAVVACLVRFLLCTPASDIASSQIVRLMYIVHIMTSGGGGSAVLW